MKQQQNRLPGVVPPACRAIRGDMACWWRARYLPYRKLSSVW